MGDRGGDGGGATGLGDGGHFLLEVTGPPAEEIEPVEGLQRCDDVTGQDLFGDRGDGVTQSQKARTLTVKVGRGRPAQHDILVGVVVAW